MTEADIWAFIEKHLTAIFNKDWHTYEQTTHPDLSLFEWWVTPHRQDGLAFHQFMIENSWMGTVTRQRFDLLEKRCQIYGNTAIVTYTLMLSQVTESGIRHRSHNESRVIIEDSEGLKVVHVHKSPATGGDGH